MAHTVGIYQIMHIRENVLILKEFLLQHIEKERSLFLFFFFFFSVYKHI